MELTVQVSVEDVLKLIDQLPEEAIPKIKEKLDEKATSEPGTAGVRQFGVP
jgi:L-cysteine desulfidase